LVSERYVTRSTTTYICIELITGPIEAQHEGARRGIRESQGAAAGKCAARWCWFATVLHPGGEIRDVEAERRRERGDGKRAQAF